MSEVVSFHAGQKWGKFFCTVVCIITAIGSGTLAFSEEEDDIRWEDAAKEVDHLPYSRSFIDSIKQANKVTPHTKPLRHLENDGFIQKETLVYEIGWGPFKAGYVVLTVEPNQKNNTIRLGGKALSNNFVSAFYRMRDYVISTVDADGLYPLIFEQHLREGKKYKADGYILYDHIVGKVFVQEKKFRELEAPAFVHDYMSVLYYVRSMQVKPGDSFKLNLFVHSKVHPIHFSGRKKEKIEVGAGTFNCVLVEPKLVGEGRAFNKKDKLKVWISDDDRRIPVLIRSKIKVGSITAKLIWYERGGNGSSSATQSVDTKTP